MPLYIVTEWRCPVFRRKNGKTFKRNTPARFPPLITNDLCVYGLSLGFLPGKEPRDVDFEGDWMIQVDLSR
jgi:hypothetical protein